MMTALAFNELIMESYLHNSLMNDVSNLHCVKTVRVRSYSGPYIPAFGLNTERHEHLTRSV